MPDRILGIKETKMTGPLPSRSLPFRKVEQSVEHCAKLSRKCNRSTDEVAKKCGGEERLWEKDIGKMTFILASKNESFLVEQGWKGISAKEIWIIILRMEEHGMSKKHVNLKDQNGR